MKSKKITGYHFSQADNRSRNGSERPFKLGEYRKLDPALVKLCSYGYHGCRQLGDLLLGGYIYGPVLELCEYDTPVAEDEFKFVSAGKKLLQRVNVEKELRLFAADCTEHVLPIWTAKHPEDTTVAACIAGARDYAEGKISRKQLEQFRDAANAAHYVAAYWAAKAANAAANAAHYDTHHAAYYAAADAAHYAAADAAYYAATAAGVNRKIEQQLQTKRFQHYMLNVLK